MFKKRGVVGLFKLNSSNISPERRILGGISPYVIGREQKKKRLPDADPLFGNVVKNSYIR